MEVNVTDPMGGGNVHRLSDPAELLGCSNFIIDRSEMWGTAVANIYTTISELKGSWAGSFCKDTVEPVEEIQPDFIDFGNALSQLAATLGTAANMYKKLEEGDIGGSVQEVDAVISSITDVGNTNTGEITFDPDQCKQKASLINDSADKIFGIIDDVSGEINHINSIYYSQNGAELVDKVQHMVDVAPDYEQTIRKFASYLVDVVAVEYEKINTYLDTSGNQ